ncbi:hypothetical protein R1sor_021441 [Riccia sorocarpa]|uniref:Uncharacterized protein n=1 Tax=Riccia sorocarpa TaxID=122646 RepID=A0ABD3GK80_9MARC
MVESDPNSFEDLPVHGGGDPDGIDLGQQSSQVEGSRQSGSQFSHLRQTVPDSLRPKELSVRTLRETDTTQPQCWDRLDKDNIWEDAISCCRVRQDTVTVNLRHFHIEKPGKDNWLPYQVRPLNEHFVDLLSEKLLARKQPRHNIFIVLVHPEEGLSGPQDFDMKCMNEYKYYVLGGCIRTQVFKEQLAAEALEVQPNQQLDKLARNNDNFFQIAFRTGDVWDMQQKVFTAWEQGKICGDVKASSKSADPIAVLEMKLSYWMHLQGVPYDFIISFLQRILDGDLLVGELSKEVDRQKILRVMNAVMCRELECGTLLKHKSCIPSMQLNIEFMGILGNLSYSW